MKNPRVSIIVANHNYGIYLESCLNSALNQDYLDIKVVVVDDASNDNSREIIDKFSDKDFRVIAIFLKECVGASEARNIAIRKVWDDTDYFMILDADDEAKPTKVREMLQKMMASPQIGVVYADYQILNVETGNLISEFKEPYDLKRLNSDCIVHSQSMCSKIALDAVKEVDETGKFSIYDKTLHGPANQQFIGCSEDFDLWIRISERFIITHIPKQLSLVRVHSQNASKIEKVNPVWQSNWNRIQEKIQKRRNANNVS